VNYASIRTCDIANGEGVRVSLFVSGCTHRCKGCFNEDAQSFAYGNPFTREVEDEILEALAPSYIAGLTLLGGEPMEPDNQRALAPFLHRFRERFGDTKTLWIYTGCVYELDLLPTSGAALGVEVNSPHKRWRTEVTDDILSMTDVLVDGPFIEELKDISLKFRGSSNQRIIHLRRLA
jgi:anaerobic ribonucleoside-triphosphate reductase activating protein